MKVFSPHTFVVVNGAVGEILETVLEAKGVASSFPQSAKLMGRYDSASVYAISVPESVLNKSIAIGRNLLPSVEGFEALCSAGGFVGDES